MKNFASMFHDDSIATQSKSDIDGKIIENMVNEVI